MACGITYNPLLTLLTLACDSLTGIRLGGVTTTLPLGFTVHAFGFGLLFNHNGVILDIREVMSVQTKINVSVENDALKKIDSYAKSIGINRSQFMTLSAMEYIKAQETLKSKEFQNQLKDLQEAVQALQENMAIIRTLKIE